MELLIISIAYCLGIIWGLYFKISIAFFLPIILIFYMLFYGKIKILKKHIVIFILFLFISNIQISILENSFINKYKNIKENIEIVGWVVSEPNYKEYKTTYIIKVEQVNNDDSFKNTKILLNIKSKNYDLKYGDKILFNTELEDAKISKNEGCFNYKEYLKTKGIYKIAYVKAGDIKLLKEEDINNISLFINRIREKIKNIVKEILPKRQAGLLIGILIGDKVDLDEEIQIDFRNSSLSHVLAVSGMHVSFVILGLRFIIDKFRIGKRKAKIFTIIFLIFFILLTGGTPSVQRACISSIYVIFGSLIYRKTNTLNSICFSMVAILFLNPYNICDIGFKLSFGGTFGIILIFPILKKYIKKSKSKMINKIKEIILVTLSVNIVIFPIIEYYFNTISTTFLISNLLISPIIGFIILIGFLMIIVSFIYIPLGRILGVLLKFLLNILLKITNIIGNLPFSNILVIKPKLYIIVFYYLLLLTFILIKNRKIKINSKYIKKIICVFIIIIIISNFILLKTIPRNLNIYFIDVGQGDCTLIVTPLNKTILIDGGGNESFNIGENTIIPFLLNKGVNKLDFIIVSHFDLDHVRSEF